MAKCTRKLIDAEAAKEAIEKLIDATQATRRLALETGFREAASGAGYCYGALKEVLSALDALPDASEGFFDYVAKEAHRTGKSPQQVFAAEWGAFVKLKDDSLWPDASEKAIHAERIPVPPHLAEAQRVVIKQAQQAGDGAEEET